MLYRALLKAFPSFGRKLPYAGVYRENCFQNIVKKEVIYLSELAIGIESEFYLMVKVEFCLI